MDKSRYSLIIASIMILLLQGCGGGNSPALGNLSDTTGTVTPLNAHKIFYITSKLEVKPDENITTTYTYHDKYLSRINRSSTDGWTDKKSYKYFDNYQVMKTYDVRDNLESISTFIPVHRQDNSNLYNRRLSFDEDVTYLLFTNDTLTYHNPYHIKKLITINTTGNLYTYNSDDLLTKIENGSYENNNSNAIDQLDNDENTTFLLSSTNTPLAFISNQETRYNYDTNGILTGITFEGQGGTLEADANVSLYNNGALKELILSTGDSFFYNSSGYLTKRTSMKNGISSTNNYTYSDDLKTITVKNASGDTVQLYTFDELN